MLRLAFKTVDPSTIVQVYAAGSAGSHQRMSATLSFQLVVPAPPFYVVRLFRRVSNSHALVGAARIRANGSITLHEWDGTVLVDHLEASGLPASTTSSGEHGDIAPDVIKQTDKAIRKCVPSELRFPSFGVDDHRQAPLSLWALHAEQLARTTLPSKAAPVLAALESWARALAPDDPLPTMLQLTTLGLRYCVDRNLAGKTIDQWSVLQSFPVPSMAVFDCEDGAHASLEVYHLLVTHGTGPLADQARRYKPYLAIGEIMSGGAYVPHCFVVLQPRNPVYPVITVESTAWSSGTWYPNVRQSIHADSEKLRMDRDRVSQWGLNEDNTRVRNPISMVYDQKIYGRLVTLVDATSYRVCTGTVGDNCLNGLKRTTPIWQGTLPPSSLHRLPVSGLPVVVPYKGTGTARVLALEKPVSGEFRTQAMVSTVYI